MASVMLSLKDEHDELILVNWDNVTYVRWTGLLTTIHFEKGNYVKVCHTVDEIKQFVLGAD